MKKFIAVAAAVLLLGSVVIASADVTFTGDSKVQMGWVWNSDFGNVTYANGATGAKNMYDRSRVRINITATNKGGAFAKVRLIAGSLQPWDGTAYTRTAYSSGGVGMVDWAYIGIPVGPVTIETGLIPDYSSLWFVFDKRFDRIMAVYATPNKATTVVGAFDKISEYKTTSAYTFDPTVDKDINDWDVEIIQALPGNWNVMLLGIYRDDQTTADMSGFLGTARVMGPAGPIKLLAEISYVDKKVVGTTDNEYGGIIHANMQFGPASITGIVGFTKNGFLADSNYGFMMMGGAMAGSGAYYCNEGSVGTPITVFGIGAHGDNTFVGVMGDYKVSNLVTLYGAAAYNHISDYGKFTEIDGLVRFNVVQDAYIDLGAAALFPSTDATGAKDDTAYGLYSELGIKF